MNKEINTCNTCGSEFYTKTSKMKNICPECAHQIYNRHRCFHKFEDGRCIKCYWNGKTSAYALKLKKQNRKKIKNAKLNVVLGIIVIAIGIIFMLIGKLYWGIFGVTVGSLFLIEAKRYNKQLYKRNNYIE
ncbi:hypothetical protein IMCC3317_19690 [Kordia antarctica]|uniref:Uncharacterized protein n=1 Tax=Kordia antarctica TaxID=1218801 RepID=A0A7L4ZK63_9FLAO|nr:hypothetical protein [Kordia antarctica]QHI36606.1 hypothetical protein IMCC3317_19690 [Kordia antarctica]